MSQEAYTIVRFGFKELQYYFLFLNGENASSHRHGFKRCFQIEHAGVSSTDPAEGTHSAWGSAHRAPTAESFTPNPPMPRGRGHQHWAGKPGSNAAPPCSPVREKAKRQRPGECRGASPRFERAAGTTAPPAPRNRLPHPERNFPTTITRR